MTFRGSEVLVLSGHRHSVARIEHTLSGCWGFCSCREWKKRLIMCDGLYFSIEVVGEGGWDYIGPVGALSLCPEQGLAVVHEAGALALAKGNPFGARTFLTRDVPPATPTPSNGRKVLQFDVSGMSAKEALQFVRVGHVF